MVSPLTYVVLGNGRWAAMIRDVLLKDQRRVLTFEKTRRRADESEEQFKRRISGELATLSEAQIAWLCIPPCDELPLLIESAIAAGLHVIVEKPWLCSRTETEALMEIARRRHVLVAVHFQYCFLDKVEELRTHLPVSAGDQFSGVFTISRGNRLGIPALQNFGSHLLAVREYSAPGSKIGEVRCGYSLPDERRASIETESGTVHAIELVTDEPLIQRFSRRFEEAIPSLEFSLNLEFAMRVSEAIENIRANNNCSTPQAQV